MRPILFLLICALLALSTPGLVQAQDRESEKPGQQAVQAQDAKPDPAPAEVKADVKPDAKAAPAAGGERHDPQPETKPKSTGDAPADQKTSAKPDAKAGAQAGAQADPKADPKAKPGKAKSGKTGADALDAPPTTEELAKAGAQADMEAWKALVGRLEEELHYQMDYVTGATEQIPVLARNLRAEATAGSRRLTEITSHVKTTGADPVSLKATAKSLERLRARLLASKAPFDKIQADAKSFLDRLTELETELTFVVKSSGITGEPLAKASELLAQVPAHRDRLVKIAPLAQRASKGTGNVFEGVEERLGEVTARLSDAWRTWLTTPTGSLLKAASWTDLPNAFSSWVRTVGLSASLIGGADGEAPLETLIQFVAILAAILLILRALRGRLIQTMGERGYAQAAAPLRLVLAAAALRFSSEDAQFLILTLASGLAEILLALAFAKLAAALALEARSAGGHAFGEDEPKLLGRLLSTLGWLFSLGVALYCLAGFPPAASALIWTLALLLARLRLAPCAKVPWRLSELTRALRLWVLPLCALASLLGWHAASMVVVSAVFLFTVATVAGYGGGKLLGIAACRLSRDSALRAAICEVASPAPTLLLAWVVALAWLAQRMGGSQVFARILSFEIGFENLRLSLSRLLGICLAFFLAKAVVAFVSESVRLFGQAPDEEGNRHRLEPGVINLFTTLSTYFLWALFCMAALSALGVTGANLAVIAGGLSVGIGFGMQNIINNFVSGLILLFGRSIQAGDTLQIGDRMGVVQKVSIRNTTVQTFDNATLFVPNSELIGREIMNWSHKDRRVRKSVKVAVPPGSDVEAVKAMLLNAAAEHTSVLTQPKPYVLMRDLDPGTLNFELFFWLNDLKDSVRTPSDILYVIEHRLREARDAAVAEAARLKAEAEAEAARAAQCPPQDGDGKQQEGN